jgi:hypothetical protein
MLVNLHPSLPGLASIRNEATLLLFLSYTTSGISEACWGTRVIECSTQHSGLSVQSDIRVVADREVARSAWPISVLFRLRLLAGTT